MSDDPMTPDDDAELWSLHPTIDDDQVEQERLYRAALPPEADEPDFDHCLGCGVALDFEDEPFLYCGACLPAARAAEPWPVKSELP